MKLNPSFLLIFITATLFSCDEKRVFDDYKSVGTAWNKDTIVSFNLPELDSTKSYNAFITLRDNNDYKYSNLFLIVSLEAPRGLTKVDTLEYQMTEPDGSLLGNGFSDIKENILHYKENVHFGKKYKLNIKQAVRENGTISGVEKLEGITEVGFRIEKRITK